MIIVVVGPTGVGKTRMSIELAKKYNAEIINADSMQIYKQLNIGTAKISNMEGIKHHMIDIRNINDEYSVYEYQKECRSIIDNLINKKNIIIVGGTGLYIKSILYNYIFDEDSNNQYEELSNEQLYSNIINLKEDIVVDKNNRRRLVRLLNKLENNSNTNNKDEKIYKFITVGLTTNRKDLYNIINNRVDDMINNGLVEEAKELFDLGINSRAINTAIGYKELYMYFNNKISLEESICLIKKNSRKYAKRQYTWFNNQMEVKWFDINYNDFSNTVNKVISYIEKENLCIKED
ncbi:MAG: tRNA (adenosine(37)-N6)-dimethylallyltransferase MiaA [Bacilli bacterium]|nr:tRNA (adenosine(37)-N6)-dimethylallyltransferase MiaA [Bacilli bacterium]